MTSRTYCFLTLGLTAVGLCAVASLNWLVDPFGQYGTQWIPSLVQDSRAEKVSLLEQYSQPPDGLILGSSRVLKFEPSYLQEKTGKTFFNAGVNHGRPTDYLAWLRWYQQRWQKLPEIVIIGVDSAALDEVVPMDARISCERRLAALVPETIGLPEKLSVYCDLLSFKQLRESIRSMASDHGSRKPTAQPAEYFAEDGRIVYRQREQQLAEGNYDFKAALEYNRREFDHLYRSFDEISSSEALRLVEVVRLLRQHGTEVYMFVTPFHPAMIPGLEKHANFEARERETRQLLSLFQIHHGVHVAELGDASRFAGGAIDFVDGIHPLETHTRGMIDQLLKSQGAVRYALQ